MDEKLQKWRDNGKHLPAFLRDFHDQKDFFKFLHESTNIQEHGLAKDVNFTQGHAYCIDVFLWVLARHGWTLQRSQSPQNFDNLDDIIAQFNKARSEESWKMLSQSSQDALPKD